MDAYEAWPRLLKGSGWNHEVSARHRRTADARPRLLRRRPLRRSRRGDPSGCRPDLGPPRRAATRQRDFIDQTLLAAAARSGSMKAAGRATPQRTPGGQAAHAARRLVGESARWPHTPRHDRRSTTLCTTARSARADSTLEASTRIDDVRIGAVRPLITPALLQERVRRCTTTRSVWWRSSRAAIAAILHQQGRDDRLVVAVVGPCSIHDHETRRSNTACA